MAPSLEGIFAAATEYANAFRAYTASGVDRALNPNDSEWSVDGSTVEPYFNVGEDALRIVVAALMMTGRPFPARILDFPSGSGRVTRHLRAFFPRAEIWASDIAADHLKFCAAQFGVQTKASREDFRRLAFETEFDVVFCGSLLTHLNERDAQEALTAISRALSPTGIAIVTFHGRHSRHIQYHKWKYIDDESFAAAEKKTDKAGFGFAPYQDDMRQRLGAVGSRYGISLVKPSWPIQQLEANSNVRVLGYLERAWDNHQDVFIFGRPGVDDE